MTDTIRPDNANLPVATYRIIDEFDELLEIDPEEPCPPGGTIDGLLRLLRMEID
jgi:hypothetical protein